MKTLLVLVPAAFALAAYLLPSDRLRAWLLPVGGVAHLLLALAAVITPEPLPVGAWLGLDPLGRLVLLLVSLLFACCSVYGLGYLRFRQQWGTRAFVSCLFLFLAAMSLSAMARHLGILWVAVEATTLASAPLIYFNRNRLSIEATWKYLLLCSVGIALAMLGILFVAYSVLPAPHISLQLDELLAGAPHLSRPWLRAGFVFLLVGFGTKAGFAPLHTWKPDAYGEAPGMVGALLAGGLTSIAFLALLRTVQIMNAAGEAEVARQALVVMGVLSLFFAAVFVIKQPDFKRLLAYSSVEHMGILAIGFGVGGLAVFGALLHMINNALVKGVLFLTAGNIHRRFDSKRREEVAGAIAVLPISASLFVAGFLAVTGSPPFGLFVSELTILQGVFSAGRFPLGGYMLLMLAVIFIGMGSTVLAVTLGKPSPRANQVNWNENFLTLAPPATLLLLVLILGLYLPEPVRTMLKAAAGTLEAGR
ncbi:MAG: proton-conducting transporter membrane subunit [Desulfobacteraceae bacterium]|nr:proton-conducting transporter membrane subunit [Desulfobacteraceae bacterium]